MTDPEINQLQRSLLLLAVGLGERKTLAEVIGERLDAVSSVIHNSERPLRRTRRLVADAVASRVYEVFGVPAADRPPSLTGVPAADDRH